MSDTIEQQLIADLKQSMIEKNEIKRETIRYLRSEIHYAKIAQKKSLNEADVIDVLSKQAQQRRDSIEAFEQGNRPELVAKEKAELDVILEYLPKQLTEDEVRKIVLKAIEGFELTGPKDMGKVMGELKKNYSDSIDFSIAGTILKELLNK